MNDREEILRCHDPVALFGTVETRELRRAYARLARAWREDDEVAAHLKALFDRARLGEIGPRPIETADDGVQPASEPPSTPLATLQAALAAGDPHRTLHQLLFGYRALVDVQPSAVATALAFVVDGYGEVLSPEERSQVEQILEDPILGLPPGMEQRFWQSLSTLEELEALEADPELPAALAACLRDTWGHPPAEIGRGWLTAARALAEVELAPVFEQLERDYPACFGRWVWLEHQLTEAAGGRPADEPLSIEIEQSYRPSKGAYASSTIATFRSAWSWLGVLLLFITTVGVLGLIATDLPAIDALGSAAFEGVFVVAVGWMGVGGLVNYLLVEQQRRRCRRAAEGPLDPLLAEARRAIRYPRELAAELGERPGLSRYMRGYFVGHALVRLDRCPWALLAVITEAHVARLAPDAP